MISYDFFLVNCVEWLYPSARVRRICVKLRGVPSMFGKVFAWWVIIPAYAAPPTPMLWVYRLICGGVYIQAEFTFSSARWASKRIIWFTPCQLNGYIFVSHLSYFLLEQSCVLLVLLFHVNTDISVRLHDVAVPHPFLHHGDRNALGCHYTGECPS